MNKFKSDQDKRVAQLIDEFNFHPLAAKIYVESNGKCIYCEKDLLATSVEYYSGMVDRLLPKAKYPELEWDEGNLVLSCFSCSSIRGEFDILNAAGPDLPIMLQKYKDILIKQIMNELSRRIQTIETERIKVKHIIRGYGKVG